VRRRVWASVGVLGLAALAGATVSIWLTEFRRTSPHVGRADKELRGNLGDPTEPAERPRFRDDDDKNLDGQWEWQSFIRDGKDGSSPPETKFLLAFQGKSLRKTLTVKGSDPEVLSEYD
jgi:hypothetical protein